MLEKNHVIKITIRVEPFSEELHADILYWDSMDYLASDNLKNLLNSINTSILNKYEKDK